MIEEQPSPMALVALEAARAGLRVFPVHAPDGAGGCTCKSAACENQGKHPCVAGWQNDATTREGQVLSWWRAFPSANLGVATGDVFVVDIDVGKGGLDSWAALLAKHDAISTATVRTGSGGFHLYFRLPEGVKLGNSVGRLGPGIDTRGAGGYVVGPGSLHASGGRYEWLEDSGWTSELAVLPAWLVGLLQGEAPQATTGGTGLVYVKGERNERMFKFAAWMRGEGFSFEEMKSTLAARNRERCRPPLSDSEVEQIARSSSKYELKADGSKDVWNLSHAGDVFGAELAPTEWLCEALQLGPGRPFGVWGAPGGGKTLFASAVGLAVASGADAFGAYPVKRGRVLHISYDSGTRAVRKRYRQLAIGMGLEWQATLTGQLDTAIFPEVYLNSPNASEKWEELCKGYALVILDNFRDSVPGAEENSSELAVFLKVLARISDKHGTCFLYLHHLKKIEGAPTVDSGRGSGAIAAASGAIWALTGIGSEPRQAKQLRTADDADGWAETFNLELTAEWQYRVTEGALEPEAKTPYLGVTGDVRFAVLRHFETHGEWRGSASSLAKHLAKRKDSVLAVVADLKTSGELSDIGTYAAPHLVYVQSVPEAGNRFPGTTVVGGESVPHTLPPSVGGGRVGTDHTTPRRNRRRKGAVPGTDAGGEL